MNSEQLLETMLYEYHIVKHIKRRCQNATPEDMKHVKTIVDAYNQFVGRRHLKVSACSIPHTVSQVQRLLVGHGKLNEKPI